MPTYTLSGLTVFLLLMIGAYAVHQARRSRKSEMALKLSKCEHALSNTVDHYKGELARLEQQLAGREPSARGSDEKFRRAKAAFARRYHPDQMSRDGEETRIRTEVFKEFWEELQRIEAGNR